MLAIGDATIQVSLAVTTRQSPIITVPLFHTQPSLICILVPVLLLHLKATLCHFRGHPSSVNKSIFQKVQRKAFLKYLSIVRAFLASVT